MTTTQRKHLGKQKAPAATTVLVDTQDATEAAAEFIYAVAAALGLDIVELLDADDLPKAAHVQVSGNVLSTETRQWHYPDHEPTFEHWLVTKCFPRVEHQTTWAVVQTGTDHYPLLAAAMAYAATERDNATLLIDADAAGTLTDTILQSTAEAIQILDFDFAMPSPHIYLLNAPVWAGVTMMLQVNGANPLNSVLVNETSKAARQHFGDVVINCGADLFMAQRLAADGAQVVHVDDYSRPLYVQFEPHKKLDYASHNIPDYGTRHDFEFIYKNTRRRKSMRRWMKRGDS